jgi:hypothetical protein
MVMAVQPVHSHADDSIWGEEQFKMDMLRVLLGFRTAEGWCRMTTGLAPQGTTQSW